MADSTTKTDSLAQSYRNSNYNIAFQYPGNWLLQEEPNIKAGDFAINAFKRGTGAEKETPLDVHSTLNHSYVTIWPHGLGTELPKSEYASFEELKDTPTLQFAIDKKQSKALLLDDGSAWAYFIAPKKLPEGWQTGGFIYAQIQTTNPGAQCYDEQTGKKLSERDCDFLEGDRYVRTGNLNQNDAQRVRAILASISLDDIKHKATATDLINIDSPLPNADVTTPLIIKGKAKGT